MNTCTLSYLARYLVFIFGRSTDETEDRRKSLYRIPRNWLPEAMLNEEFANKKSDE